MYKELLTTEERNVLLTTEDYSVYKNLYSKLVSSKEGYYIRRYNHDHYSYFCRIGDMVKLPKGTKLYHVSETKNITNLKSSFRSQDSILYTKQRIYFLLEDKIEEILSWDKMDLTKSDVAIYEYICNGNESIRIDTEFDDYGYFYIFNNNESFELEVKSA